MNTSLTAALAEAHISELRRQACRAPFTRSTRRARRPHRVFPGRHRTAAHPTSDR